MGVHELVVDAVQQVDMDLRKALFSNIVLSGGTTLTRGDIHRSSICILHYEIQDLYSLGFGDRLLDEIRRLAVKDTKIKIYAPPERKYSTWIGGSILASLGHCFFIIFTSIQISLFMLFYLGTFKKMWVTAEEYQEDPDIIHKKMSL